ncbi:biotin transporter BioY [Cytobacillus oceanisediminis]|jgi:biotin transport system substrate-specific component|uniref:biotin transporter BioY n=1 Tax=Cytobacillus oceanisediminis TaxID=665099 RepID=UPI001C214EBB|nr:biotin transporter BioY [Cytobacillus oceanisediminis]MBU8769954.1 biotin transporter BioY [Cytobacillus oceanisediminis]
MKTGLRTIDLTLAGMFVGLMAVGANITSFVPFLVIGGVPITLQTFFAILAGAILGSRLGAITMAVYAFAGLAGAPVFSKFGGGFASLLSPTFGFILSFIVTAYVTGKLIEKKKSVPVYITAALIGMVINYVFGTNWMYMAYKLWFTAPEGFTYHLAWLWMAVPLPKDIILSVFAGLMAHRLEHRVFSSSQFRKMNRAA